MLRSLGRQRWAGGSRIREKELNSQAEAGDFFRQAGCQKALEQRMRHFHS